MGVAEMMETSALAAVDPVRPRVCFVAHSAYGALARMDTGHIGGIERQTSLMARWFAARGYDTSMITWDEGQPDGATIDGVRVFKVCRKDAGVKGLRFFHPRWTGLWRAMSRADADLYYYNCGDLGLGQVVMWCRRHGRKSVYSVANVLDCDARCPRHGPLRERVLYRYGLAHVDAVIVQTRWQQQMLRNGFGIESIVIPMPCEGFAPRVYVQTRPSRETSPRVLWIGRISQIKRLEWLLDIAERCPEIAFDVVGASNTDSHYASALMKRAAGIRNVNMHGRVLHAATAGFYDRCRILCCTSSTEGFPNTFLEAWSCGVPVVSTYDPDGVIAGHNLGWVASDVDGLIDGLRMAIGCPEKWRAASQAARSYCVENHWVDVAMPKFANLFGDIVRGRES